jgi:spermidine synthase
MSLKVRDGGNQIAFAFKNPDFYPAWERLKPIAIELSRKLGLDFVRYLEQLQKNERRTFSLPRKSRAR